MNKTLRRGRIMAWFPLIGLLLAFWFPGFLVSWLFGPEPRRYHFACLIERLVMIAAYD
jgi:hypothetical protein